MKTTSLSLATALTLILSVSVAQAATTSANSVSGDPAYEQKVDTQHSISQDVKKGLRRADSEMRETADQIKAFFVGDDDTMASSEPIYFNRHLTAQGLIGEPVLNPAGERVGKLKDILVDSQGKAILAIVADEGFLGIDKKLAAFDYGRVVSQKEDGDVVMALNEDMIKRAAEFTYDVKDRKMAKVIPPADSASAKDILDGELYDNNGKKVGDIENLTFKGNDADHLIVGFDKKLGFGGELAALTYTSLERIKRDGEVDFKMSASQSSRFSNLKVSSK